MHCAALFHPSFFLKGPGVQSWLCFQPVRFAQWLAGSAALPVAHTYVNIAHHINKLHSLPSLHRVALGTGAACTLFPVPGGF